jgi:hypothetical protein
MRKRKKSESVNILEKMREDIYAILLFGPNHPLDDEVLNGTKE